MILPSIIAKTKTAPLARPAPPDLTALKNLPLLDHTASPKSAQKVKQVYHPDGELEQAQNVVMDTGHVAAEAPRGLWDRVSNISRNITDRVYQFKKKNPWIFYVGVLVLLFILAPGVLPLIGFA